MSAILDSICCEIHQLNRTPSYTKQEGNISPTLQVLHNSHQGTQCTPTLGIVAELSIGRNDNHFLSVSTSFVLSDSPVSATEKVHKVRVVADFRRRRERQRLAPVQISSFPFVTNLSFPRSLFVLIYQHGYQSTFNRACRHCYQRGPERPSRRCSACPTQRSHKL